MSTCAAYTTWRDLPDECQQCVVNTLSQYCRPGLPPSPCAPQCASQDYKLGHGASPFPLPDPRTSLPRYSRPGQDPRLGQDIGGRFRLLNQLGTGAYGIVYLAWDLITAQYCAVKSLNRVTADGRLQDVRALEFQAREIRAHWKVQEHPNVVSMFGIVQDPDCIYVVLEYCEEGDLFQNITECDKYVGNDRLVAQVYDQILDAVDHCHSMGIYHRDLKPENILVADHGNQVKLADFGLAIEHQVSDDYGCGSTFYMSPECLDQASHRDSFSYDCAPNDVWSLGVILVNLTCGRNPWKEASPQDATYRVFLKDPSFLMSILPITEELNNILRKVFQQDPAQRITIPQLRREIAACREFTIHATMPLSPPATPRSPLPEDITPDAVLSYNDPMDSDPGSPLSTASDTDSEPWVDFSEIYSRTASPLSSDWQIVGCAPAHPVDTLMWTPPSPPSSSSGSESDEDGDVEASQPSSPLPVKDAAKLAADFHAHRKPPSRTKQIRAARYKSTLVHEPSCKDCPARARLWNLHAADCFEPRTALN